jgi:hypothetical protein
LRAARAEKFAAAKAPLDGFEQQFGSFIQQELLKKQYKSEK